MSNELSARLTAWANDARIGRDIRGADQDLLDAAYAIASMGSDIADLQKRLSDCEGYSNKRERQYQAEEQRAIDMYRDQS